MMEHVKSPSPTHFEAPHLFALRATVQFLMVLFGQSARTTYAAAECA